MNRTNFTSSVDLEAVQSLLAMSQWSPPSPPQSETRSKEENYSERKESWTPNDGKELQVYDDEMTGELREPNRQEFVKVRISHFLYLIVFRCVNNWYR